MNELSIKIVALIQQSRNKVASFANTAMVYTYFEIGKMIVEELQHGEKRAAYGKKLLEEVSAELKSKIGRGFSVTNLKQMRDFYTAYAIRQINSDELKLDYETLEIAEQNQNPPADKSKKFIFTLSWSHYLLLIRIENKDERRFYEIESSKNNWKLTELERQFNSSLYERLALSRDKETVLNLAKKGQVLEKPQDILKEPLVLEFLGIEEKAEYSETELETAIINEIEKFMLELGKGFFFGGRQVRFTFDEDHYRVDLVFYNRLLQCFVLIDLKIGKLTHQDLGQMQMYVNYYDRFEKSETENPSIGIILCKDKNQSLVEITLPKNNEQIFAAKYQTFLPTKKELQDLLNHYEQK